MIEDSFIDDEAATEIESFDNLPYEKVCYFRPKIFSQVIAAIRKHISEHDKRLKCAELGGGEGYLASHLFKAFPEGKSYVCDLSTKQLSNAPNNLVKVRCDIRYPYVRRGSLDLAAFWVSLHHFSQADQTVVLSQARDALRSNGMLVVFEPNEAFALRRILFSNPLKQVVYSDEHEKALFHQNVRRQLLSMGFRELMSVAVNPPYNTAFLRSIRIWPVLLLASEFFYSLDRFVRFRRKRWWMDEYAGSPQVGTLWLGSYVLSLWQKSR